MSIKYPYTDFHEMNLDWTMETVKKADEQSAEAVEKATTTEERVNEFFDNLDLQTEVDNKLDNMATDGSLAEVIEPLVPAPVTTWLEENITPTTPAIDSSLTVKGAAADAKATGEAVRNATPLPVADLNNLTAGGWYFIGYSDAVANAPTATGQRYVKNVYVSSVLTIQMFLSALTHELYVRQYENGTWSAWELINSELVFTALSNGDDLNNMTDSGWYYIGYSVSVNNAPVAAGQRFLQSLRVSSAVILQLFYDAPHNTEYMRFINNGTPTAWDIVNKSEILGLKNATDMSDMNTITDTGVYYIGYSSAISPSPVSIGRRYLMVYTLGSLTLQLLYHPLTNAAYIREGQSGTWSAWSLINDAGSDTKFIESANYSSSSTLQNTGDKFTVMSYNVANYNNDTTTYINDAQISEFKKAITHDDIDVVALQEHRQYINSGNTKASANYLFKPVYVWNAGVNGTSMFSRVNGSNNQRVVISNNRSILGSIFTVNGKRIGLVSAHPTAALSGYAADSPQSIAARLQEYTEIFDWAFSSRSLPDTGGTQRTFAAHDYTIICMDSNALTAEDRTNLKNIADSHNMTLGNGGYLGWINTSVGGNPIDNVIVSNNIIINRFTVLESMGKKLYSDHYPVIANLTIT